MKPIHGRRIVAVSSLVLLLAGCGFTEALWRRDGGGDRPCVTEQDAGMDTALARDDGSLRIHVRAREITAPSAFAEAMRDGGGWFELRPANPCATAARMIAHPNAFGTEQWRVSLTHRIGADQPTAMPDRMAMIAVQGRCDEYRVARVLTREQSARWGGRAGLDGAGCSASAALLLARFRQGSWRAALPYTSADADFQPVAITDGDIEIDLEHFEAALTLPDCLGLARWSVVGRPLDADDEHQRAVTVPIWVLAAQPNIMRIDYQTVEWSIYEPWFYVVPDRATVADGRALAVTDDARVRYQEIRTGPWWHAERIAENVFLTPLAVAGDTAVAAAVVGTGGGLAFVYGLAQSGTTIHR